MAETTITFDAGGRTFVMRKVGTGMQMKIIRMLGSDLAKNEAYVTMANVAASIVSIDGAPLPLNYKPETFELVANQIGDDLAEVTKQYGELSLVAQDKGIDDAKNLPGTPS